MDDTAYGVGHNRPPSPLDEATQRVHERVAAANAWAHEVREIASADVAAKCQALIEQIRAERRAVDEQRIAEKRPHDEAAAAVQRAWMPLIDLLDACMTVLNALRRQWLTREEERRRQEAEQAAARAADLANAAALAQQAVESGTARSVEAQIEARHLSEQAAEAARAAEAAAAVRPQIVSDLTGRASGLRQRWRAEIFDRRAALIHFHNHPKLCAVLQQIADAEVRAVHDKVPIPGVKAVCERV